MPAIEAVEVVASTDSSLYAPSPDARRLRLTGAQVCFRPDQPLSTADIQESRLAG